VTSTGLLGLDLACRGGAAALFSMIAAVLLRDHRTKTVHLGAALTGAGAAYALIEAPGFPSGWWSPFLVFVSSGGPVAFWLWARVTFDDDFRLKRWHVGLWAALAAARLFFDHDGVFGAHLTGLINRGLTMVNLALALLAVVQTMATWRSDLVAGRRRLRVAVLIGTFTFMAADATANLSLVAVTGSDIVSGNLERALGLLVLALATAWGTLGTVSPQLQGSPGPTAVFGPRVEEERPDDQYRPAVDPMLLRRLQKLMSEERIYRREGLTIGTLAVMLNLPEYRLRQVINEGLGHRNFNAFLNSYRIDEAKAALTDPDQRDVPVLTIAMDSGFQSIGPFNRAFKADAGVTPTEFRRLMLAGQVPEPASSRRLLP
jgi:AraC-like DNA-binding protein